MILDIEDTQDEVFFRKKYLSFLQQDILFDVEPLLLYLVGTYDSKHGTNLLSMYGYTNEHYLTLLQLIELLKKSPANFVVTPQILFSAIRHIHYDCEDRYKIKNYCDSVLEDISGEIKPHLTKLKEIYAKKDDIISHTHFLGKWKLHSISLDIVDKEQNNCRIILTKNKLVKEHFKEDKKILVIPLREFQLNASQYVY